MEAKTKGESHLMTLYKAIPETINDLDTDPQIELAKLMLNLQVMQGSTMGVEVLFNPRASNSFISQQVWKSLL